MGRMNEVMSELESIGAVGEVVLLRPEAPKLELAPPLPPRSLPNERYWVLEERLRLAHEVCEESLLKLAVLAKEVQDLQNVFTQLSAVTLLEPEGAQDAEIRQEA